jgi:hypothetical protein
MKLTRKQQRQMQKHADRVDRVRQADRRFFERFPHRQHRVRLTSQAELAQFEILKGRPTLTPPGCHLFTIVRNVAPGVRLWTLAFGPEGADTDISEPMARAMFEAAATPKTREIEAKLRAAVGARE